MISTGLVSAVRRTALRMPLASHAMPFSMTATPLGRFADHIKTLQPNVKEMTVSELDKRLCVDHIHGPPANLHILDVRETYEWNEDHIPFAHYTGRGNLERDIEGVVPDLYDDVVLYCAGGMRSIIAADSLQKMGYRNVYSLTGGIAAWKKASLPIVSNFKTFSEQVKDY
ncbi:hypothetical protein QVD99_001645 [Batrachochytrium dendrobatidis]|nr:hypothetical protein O5D80_000295 [Batrachochytrium dendrobatidis]KAK5671813.1 hypothetical protein QVD99_001645 [Batrachochytrium dendrobatidis]